MQPQRRKSSSGELEEEATWDTQAAQKNKVAEAEAKHQSERERLLALMVPSNASA